MKQRECVLTFTLSCTEFCMFNSTFTNVLHFVVFTVTNALKLNYRIYGLTLGMKDTTIIKCK